MVMNRISKLMIIIIITSTNIKNDAKSPFYSMGQIGKEARANCWTKEANNIDLSKSTFSPFNRICFALIGCWLGWLAGIGEEAN